MGTPNIIVSGLDGKGRESEESLFSLVGIEEENKKTEDKITINFLHGLISNKLGAIEYPTNTKIFAL